MCFEAAALEWKKHDMRHTDTHDMQDAERESVMDFTYSVRAPSLLLNSEEETGDKKGNSENISDEEKKILGRVIEAALTENDLLAKIARHEAHLLRQIERLLDQLRKLKAERSDAQTSAPERHSAGGSEQDSIAA